VQILSCVTLIAFALALAGCPKYKPYLPEEYRGPVDEPAKNLPGIFTGRKGEFVIYER